MVPHSLRRAPPVSRFDKAAYLALKRELMVKPHTGVTLLVMLLIAVTGSAGYLLSAHGGWRFFASQLLLAAFFFQGFALLHECGHYTASPHRAVNVVVGHLASVICFLPFYPWRFIHQEHHTWTGNPDKDPSLGAVKAFRRAKRVPPLVRWAWRSWLPLAALLQHFVFWSYPVVLARRPGTDWRKLVRAGVSVGVLATAYLLLYHFAGPYLPLRRFALALVLYLAASELVNLPHHVGAPTSKERLPLWEQWRATRSCVYPRVLSELLVLNFNFHTEHHLFPNLPWYRLRAARARVKAAIGAGYQEEVGAAWNLRHRTQDFADIVLTERLLPPLASPAAMTSVREQPGQDGLPGERGRVVRVHEIRVPEVEQGIAGV